MQSITIQTTVKAPLEKVWSYWTKPEHIIRWNFASDDWGSPFAEIDLREGGKFTARMQAKDGSAGFNFGGTYTLVEERARIGYVMDDGRKVFIEFAEVPEGVRVTESFDPENENPEELQRAGWQAILDNFKKYVESN